MAAGQQTNVFPIGYAITVGSLAVATVLLPNPTRNSMIIQNASLVAVAVCPGQLSPTGQPLPFGIIPGFLPVVGGAGSFTLQAGGVLIFDTIFCMAGWLAIAASGTANPLTVMEA